MLESPNVSIAIGGRKMGSQCTEEVLFKDLTYRVDFDLGVADKPARRGTKCPKGHDHKTIVQRRMVADEVEVVCEDTHQSIDPDSKLGKAVVRKAIKKSNDRAETHFTCDICDKDYHANEMTLP